MTQLLTPTTAHLLVCLQDGRVYCIPRSILSANRNCTEIEAARSQRSTSPFSLLKDLTTGNMFLLLTASLDQFSIADWELGDFIRRFGVRGTNTPYKTRPSMGAFGVPLYGNVTDPKWAAINLGGLCNSRCTFCYTEWTRAVPNFRTDEVKDVIDRIAEIGTTRMLVFSGGEATLRDDLVELFEYAKRSGFSDLALDTNGRELKKIDMVAELAAVGLNRVLLSLHGPNSEIHDRITASSGSFKDALEGLRNLRSFSIEPTVNIVICRDNYKHLSEVVFLLGTIFGGSGSLRFSYPIIEGAAFDNVDKVIVRFSELRPLMLEAMKLAETMGFRVQAANMPLCIPDDAHRRTTYDTVVLSEFVEVSPFYAFNIPRGEKSVKLESCTQCSKAALCRGIQVEYLRKYPDSTQDFRPIT